MKGNRGSGGHMIDWLSSAKGKNKKKNGCHLIQKSLTYIYFFQAISLRYSRTTGESGHQNMTATMQDFNSSLSVDGAACNNRLHRKAWTPGTQKKQLPSAFAIK